MRALIIVAGVVLVGCVESGKGDAPLGPVDDTPADIINMPDSFANIAFKCRGGNGIYVTTRDAAPVIVPNDPECAEAGGG